MTDLIISEQKDNEYPFTAKVLSGDVLETTKLGRFVIDIESLTYHKPRLIVDYNHDDKTILGHAENFRTEKEGDTLALYADGRLIADEFTDRLMTLAKHDTPFEISPSITEKDGYAEKLPKNQEAIVNGRGVKGPLTIFRNMPIRGFAVCPFGTDKYTELTMLKERITKMSEPNTDTNPPKDELLQKFLDRFGATKGVELYQKGIDYDELDKAWTLIEFLGFSVKSPDEPEPEPEPIPEPAPANDTTALKAMVTELKTEITALRAAIPRGAEPVSGAAATVKKPEPKTFEEKAVAAYNRQK